MITLDNTFVLKMRGASGLVQDDWGMYSQEGGMKATYVLMYNLGERNGMHISSGGMVFCQRLSSDRHCYPLNVLAGVMSKRLAMFGAQVASMQVSMNV